VQQQQQRRPSAPFSVSEYSSERAVRRGWRRGSSERNDEAEVGSLTENGDWHSEFDVTAVTEAGTEDWTRASRQGITGTAAAAVASKKKRLQQQQRQQQSKQTKKGRIFSKKGGFKLPWKRRSSGSSASSLAKKGGDAWMCGVCGRAFLTLESADKHESRHIQQVVDSLGWAMGSTSTSAASMLNNDSFVNTPSNAHDLLVRKRRPSFGGDGEPATANANAQQHEKQQQPQQQPPHQQQHSMRGGEKVSMIPTSSSMRRSAYQKIRSLEPFQENKEEDNPNFDFFQEVRGFPSFEEEKIPEDEDNDNNRKPPARMNTRSMMRTSSTSNKPPPIDTIMHQFESDGLVPGALIPRPRARTNSEVRFDTAGPTIAGGGGGYDPLMGVNQDYLDESMNQPDSLLLSKSMRDYVVLADEALITVCETAEPLILTKVEMEAERELKLLAGDKSYYDQIAERSLARRKNPSNRFRTDGEHVLGKVTNKFVDAYQLMKEGNAKTMNDQYNRKKKGEDDISRVIVHTDQTLYVNVMVKNSVEVVRHELERLARKRWEKVEEIEKFTRFERFRVYAHVNIVKLAGIALASDFTVRESLPLWCHTI
jgi:hypothetical protein